MSAAFCPAAARFSAPPTAAIPSTTEASRTARKWSRDISGQVIANAAKLGIDAIITIGGDGSQKIGYELFQKGMKIVGVPKTIDNDLSATEVTFGFDTALHTVTDAIDKIHTTAESHHRVMVVEVMGRDCGWIALHAGIAGGAHVILIPGNSVHHREHLPLHRASAKRPASTSPSSWWPKA